MPDQNARDVAAGPGEALFAPEPRPTATSAQPEPSAAAQAAGNEVGQADRVCRAEFGKVVAQRQAAKEKVRQLTAEMERLLERLRAVPDPRELRDFQDWKRRQQQAGLPADQQDQDVQSIEQRLRRPLEARIEGLAARKDALEKRLTDVLRDQELRVAAARAHAISPEQVVAMLRSRVRMVEAEEGRFVPEFLDADGQVAFDGPQPVMDAQRFVDLFLAEPENANLARSNVTPGSGARQAGGPHSHLDPMPRSRAEFMALPPEERRAVAGRMTRPQRDVLLGRAGADGGGYL